MSREEKRVYIFSADILLINKSRWRDLCHKESDKATLQRVVYSTDKESAAKRAFIGTIKEYPNIIVRNMEFICEMSLDEYDEAGLNESVGTLG